MKIGIRFLLEICNDESTKQTLFDHRQWLVQKQLIIAKKQRFDLKANNKIQLYLYIYRWPFRYWTQILSDTWNV